jgi:quercetin dioxygenase-like cupin family protein
MDRQTEAFRRELAELGYPDVLTREWPPNHFVDTHTHDFAVRALVLEGEFVLTCEGHSQRYAAGEVFTLEARVPHTEQYGPSGAVYLVGRRAV